MPASPTFPTSLIMGVVYGSLLKIENVHAHSIGSSKEAGSGITTRNEKGLDSSYGRLSSSLAC